MRLSKPGEQMSVKLAESGYNTLKMFLLSCPATVGEKVLDKYYNYKGNFPVTISRILDEFAWVIKEIPGNAFQRLEKFANEENINEIDSDFVCVFFGGENHLEDTRNTCVIFDDLSLDEKMAGHMAIPVKVSETGEGWINGEVLNDGTSVENIVNPFNNTKVGDIVLVHFATVVVSNPNRILVEKLLELQKDFRKNELKKVNKIKYNLAFENTRKKIERVLGLS